MKVLSLRATLLLLGVTCTVLAGCASASSVTPSARSGVFSVSASATGGRLAWARAHERAISAATDYCEGRGMRTSLAVEQTNGFKELQQQESVVQFECHPRF
jgi:TolA-binding protein